MITLPRSRLARAAICIFGGTIQFLSCADFDIWPLAWIGFLPTLLVTLDETCENPFLYGYLTGLLANGGGFYWINSLLQRFGHMPLIASAPIFTLLIAYQAIMYGAFALALRRLRDGTRLPLTLLAPVVFVATEFVMPYIFPWYYAITQAWVVPVIQIADLTGPLGVSALLLLVNGALHDTLAPLLQRSKSPASSSTRPSPKPLAIALGIVALALVYGQVRIHQVEAMQEAAPKIKVGVVQANIGINEKWHQGTAARQLAVHQALSKKLEQAGADLIVWPESSYPYAIDRTQTADFPDDDPRRVKRGFTRPLLFGALTLGGGDSPYPFNTALLLDETGTIRGTFDKNFLLVFGEYIPFYEHLKWFRELVPEASNFARGTQVTTFPLAGWKLGPMICYEDIIPSFGRRLGAQRPNLFVNITNDAWFGATSEPWEHMALSVYRTVEHRLQLVRAVNTGVSAYIDATGRVVEKSKAVDPVVTPGVPPVALLHEVAMLEPTGLYGRIGDVFGALNLLATLLLASWARGRSGRPLDLRALAAALGLLVALLALSALAVGGPSSFTLALRLIAHDPGAGGRADDTFAIGMRLVLAGALCCIATGFMLRRTIARAGSAPRVEAAAAAIATFLLPPLAFGRVEGETASLVFTSIGGALLVLLGMRLARRR